MNPELIETVKRNPRIEFIHFDSKGTHYFNVYVKDDKKYGRFLPAPGGKLIPDVSTTIVNTLDREQFLAGKKEGIAKPVEDEAILIGENGLALKGDDLNEKKDIKKSKKK